MNIVWRLIDQKPGHQNQSAGLSNALERIASTECFDISVKGRWQHLVELLMGSFPLGGGLPPPDLIIGAGHATHFALLAANRRYGGKSLVLMRPSLPAGWFDFCVVPKHDGMVGGNVFSTRGVINTVRSSPVKNPDQMLLLIGGDSKHRQWNDESLVQQITEIAQQAPSSRIMLTNSRRTPKSFLHLLERKAITNLDITPWEQTGPGWVNAQLAQSKFVWVTPDSVSMVYEAITAGAAVGLFDMSHKRASRVNGGIDALIADQWVSSFSQWHASGILHDAPDTFCEADRCAEWILDNWRDD